jgi:adenylate kinase
MNGSTKSVIIVSLIVLTGFGVYYYKHVAHRNAYQEITTVVEPKTILAFLGAPGSGKGTLAKQAVVQMHFKSLSTGDLCREEVASGSEKGKMLAQYMKGGLIPDDVMTDMVDGWLSKNAGSEPIILDGYPRTQKQAEMLAGLLKAKYADYVFGVISLTVSDEEEVVRRIANRMVCEQCHAVYSRALMADPNATVCPKCGGKLVRREDDTEEVVRARLQTFMKNNNEIIAYYKEIGMPVELINVSHTTPETIFKNFKQILPAYGQKQPQVELPTPQESPEIKQTLEAQQEAAQAPAVQQVSGQAEIAIGK